MYWFGDMRATGADHVPESRFGLWFLATDTWAVHVLARAVTDLERLIAQRRNAYPVVVDVGCGFGRSFKLLQDRFGARRIIGVDIDEAALAAAAQQASRDGVAVEILQASSS